MSFLCIEMACHSLLMVNKDPWTLHNQYNGCWWPGTARSGDSSSHSSDSGNGLVPLGNKPLPEALLIEVISVTSECVYIYYNPCTTKLLGGILVSLHPSVCLSVRLTSHVCSVAPTVLVGSISYLCILSSNFRKCVTCKVSCKIWTFGNFLKFITLTLSCFDLGSDMNHWYG